ncbi:MAG: ABC-2 transporter permease [Defluviitaleaceae bacterium]|nr:ABC-2 transporter permease [Defluviitaleaceae bacterium]
MIKNFFFLDLSLLKGDIRRFAFFLLLLIFAGYSNMGIYGVGLGLIPNLSYLATLPFSGGANGLDTLYNTLGISRAGVVRGRYVFALIFSVLLIAFFGVVGVGLAQVTNEEINYSIYIAILASNFLIAVLALCATLPVLFKFGYKKARFYTTIGPMLLLIMLLMLNNFFGGGTGSVLLMPADIEVFSLLLLGVAILLVSLPSSYFLSVYFYKKRDF